MLKAHSVSRERPLLLGKEKKGLDPTGPKRTKKKKKGHLSRNAPTEKKKRRRKRPGGRVRPPTSKEGSSTFSRKGGKGIGGCISMAGRKGVSIFVFGRRPPSHLSSKGGERERGPSLVGSQRKGRSLYACQLEEKKEKRS